ncbi:MAG: protein kinase [Chloroflexi bacterium]|nr:protein kinase [Chloroflexota bacterium]
MRVDYLEGQLLGQYEIKKLLGAGGMGYVYTAYQPRLKRDVAIKVLPAEFALDSEYMERFEREAEIAASLEHPNIVPILDYGMDQGISFVVMRMLTGGTLADRLKQRHKNSQPLPSLREIIELVNQLAGALDYAHQQGVIHRDIKPNNIMFDSHGNAYIVDFGIARLLHATTQLTATGQTMGTPTYMSPEQWQGEAIGAAADQYSIAVVTYELLAGRPPFEAATPFAFMHKHVYEAPPPLDSIVKSLPAEMSVVLDRALSKQSEDRYPAVTDFAQALEGAANQVMDNTRTGFFTYQVRQPTRPRPAGPSPTMLADTPTHITDNPSRGKKRSRYLIPAFLVVLLLIAGGIFIALDNGDENDNPTSNTAGPTPTTDNTVFIAESSPTPAPTELDSSDTPSPGGATQVTFNLPPSAAGDEAVPLSDDFEDGTYADTWDQFTWTESCAAVQEQGVLHIISAEDNLISCRLRNMNVSSLNDIQVYEAQFLIPDTEAGNNTDISLYLNQIGGNSGMICGLSTRFTEDIDAYFLHWLDGDIVVEESERSSIGEWHTLRLEYYPTSNEINCLHDGELVGTVNIAGLERNLIIGLELHLSIDSDTVGFVDNVRMASVPENIGAAVYSERVLVYDDFNAPSFLETYDTTRWAPYEEAERCGFSQSELEPGLIGLVFHNEGAAGNVSVCSLRMTQTIRLDQPLIFSAEAAILDNEEGHYSNQGIIVRDPQDSWFVYCGLDTRDSDTLDARFIMSNTIETEAPAEFGEWVKLNLWYDPETNIFECAVNEEVIGSSEIPPSASLDGEFYLILENLRSAPDTNELAARGFMDNVLVNRDFGQGMTDDFDDPRFVEAVDPVKWEPFDLTEDCAIFQIDDAVDERGGILSMNNFREDGDPGRCALAATVTGSFAESFVFEGDVYVPDTAPGHTTNQALLIATDDRTVRFYCALDTQYTDGVEAKYIMPGVSEDAIPAGFEAWVTLRIAYNHEEGLIACFANDELVGEDIIPENVDRAAPLRFVLENFRSEDGASASGYVDNVRIEK